MINQRISKAVLQIKVVPGRKRGIIQSILEILKNNLAIDSLHCNSEAKQPHLSTFSDILSHCCS